MEIQCSTIRFFFPPKDKKKKKSEQSERREKKSLGKLVHRNACLRFLHRNKGNYTINSGPLGSQSRKGDTITNGIRVFHR